MFGYSDEEIVGQPVDMLFMPEDRAAACRDRNCGTRASDGRAADERWHLRKDGSRFYCSGVMAPLTDGALYGYAKIARDLTEQQRAAAEREQRVRARQQADRAELEDANRLKDRVPRDAVARAEATRST